MKHWKRVRVLCRVVRCFNSLYRDVQNYGATMHFYTVRTPLTHYTEMKATKDQLYVLHSRSLFLQFWSVLMYSSLLWSAIVSVFVSAFLDIQIQPWLAIEELFSLLCLLDIAVTTMASYKDLDHVNVLNFPARLRHYSRSYLFVDCIAW